MKLKRKKVAAVDPHPLPASTEPDADDGKQAAAGPFLSIREAAAWLCVSTSTVKRMLAGGDLQAVRIGKRRKLSADTLTAHVTKNILIPRPDDSVLGQ
jgi:excisionase family DNA binding protein